MDAMPTRSRDALLVLVASPLLGLGSWAPLREALASRGWASVAAHETRDPLNRRPFWQRTVDGVEQRLRGEPDGRTVVLVGHSGAGPLLPAVAGAIGQRVAAYLFVDAGLPAPGISRLGAIAAEGPHGAGLATELAAILDAGGRFPEWTDAELAPLIPDAERRRQVLAELRPRGRDYWSEPLPTVSGWPHAPCAYLSFSEPYQPAAERATAMGWQLRHLPGGHFHHLVDEHGVADALLKLLAEIGTGDARPLAATTEDVR
jgi:hypothetical protein